MTDRIVRNMDTQTEVLRTMYMLEELRVKLADAWIAANIMVGNVPPEDRERRDLAMEIRRRIRNLEDLTENFGNGGEA